jgi:hypothetical protein
MTDIPSEPKLTAGKPAEYWKGVFMAIGLAVAVPMAFGTVFGTIGTVFGFVLGNSLGNLVSGLGGVGALAFFGIGLVQWLWITPISRRYRSQGRDSLAQGLVTGAWIVFLLNASCWGILGGVLLLAK